MLLGGVAERQLTIRMGTPIENEQHGSFYKHYAGTFRSS